MANLQPWIIKDLASDGGFKSRKLWAFVVTLAAGVPLAWFNKLNAGEITMFLGLFTLYCVGNLAAKQIVTGRNLRRLMTSTSQVTEVTSQAPTPTADAATKETNETVIAELKADNERLKDQLLHHTELVDIKSQHELWKEQMMRRAEMEELKRENERLKAQTTKRIKTFDELE